MELQQRSAEWLDTAVSGIRFGPDRSAARAELAAHLEDKLAGLHKRFPDIPPEEAEQRALDGMGDAEEIRRALAKVHPAWLGYLWLASEWAVMGMVLVMACCMLLDTGEDSILGRTSEQVFCNIQDGARASLGGYSIQITGAVCLDRLEERNGLDTLQVVVRISSPRFWERVQPDAFYRSLTVVSADGTRYSMDGWTKKNYGPVDQHGGYMQYIYIGARISRWGPAWREFAVYIPAEGWEAGDQVRLEFDSAVGRASLSVPVTERVDL